ncbi:MAG: hypothetical protein H7844_00080 [Nitrospirae bacterium YQR-1]
MLSSETGLKSLIVLMFCLLAAVDAFAGLAPTTTTAAATTVPVMTNSGQLVFAVISGIGGVYFIIKAGIKK